MNIVAGSASHVGLVRAGNEDASHCGRRLWVVADGMGGQAAGEVASALAVEQVRRLDESAETLDEGALVAAVEAANDALRRYAWRHPRAWGLATTLVGAAVVTVDDGERLCVFNVGDSRAYRLAHGRLAQVTTDHSEVEELRSRGVITAAEARGHPLGHLVTRWVGMPAAPAVDTWLVSLRPGERLLLCSDGLTGEVTDADLAATLLAAPDPQEAADRLVAAALASGGRDNVTVIVLDAAAGDER